MTSPPRPGQPAPRGSRGPEARPGRPAPAPAPAPSGPGVPAPPPWWRTLRADPPFPIRIGLGAGLIALVFLVWWFVTRGDAISAIISPSKLPSPGAVFRSYGSLGDNLSDGIISTLERVVAGVLLAAVIGVVLGVFAATNRAIGSAVAPVVIFLRSIPMGALLPLMLMLFATGEKQKVMFIFFAIVPFVFSDTVKAISIVPQRYIETAQTLGASNRQILRKVLVPLALPDIITSLRFQFGLALGYVMLAEAIGALSGLGVMLNTNQRLGKIEQNYALLFIIALLAFGIDFVIRFFQRGVFQWRSDL
ncbi:MAG TPA: ABC transporter permease [Kofleriaceae bacterium]|nr:ABC transporter permease [Kofleriaceae bacterium]